MLTMTRRTVPALVLGLLALAGRLPGMPPGTSARAASAAPAAVTRAVLFLPLVGHFDRAALAPVVNDRFWYYGETNQALDVAVDRTRHVVWAATAGGLVRRDLVTGARSRLTLQRAEHVAVDSTGAPWIARTTPPAKIVVSRLNEDGSWRHYTEADGLARGYLSDLAADRRGGVWVAMNTSGWSGSRPTDGGLSWISPTGAVTTYGLATGWPSQSISHLAPDGDGGVWFTFGDYWTLGEYPAGVGHLAADGQVVFIDEAHGLPARYLDVQVVDVDGTMIATRSSWDFDHGLETIYRRAPDGMWHAVDLPADVPIEGIDYVTVDPLGARWFISTRVLDGIRLLPDGTWQPIVDPMSAPPIPDLISLLGGLRTVAFEADGTAWFASGQHADGWVRRLPSSEWQVLGDPYGSVPNRVHRLAVQADYTAWLAEGGAGLHQLRTDGRGAVRHWTGGHVVDLLSLDSAGNLWTRGSGGLLRQSADGRRRDTLALPADLGTGDARPYIRVVAAAPDGAVWVGTSAGVARWDPAGTWRIVTAEDWPLTSAVTAIAFDGQAGTWLGATRWVRSAGTEHEEVVPGGLAYVDARGAVTALTHERLAMARLMDLATDGAGGLWVATTADLLHLDAARRWTVAALPDGLADTILSLAVDHDGHVWLGTAGRGLHRRDPDGTWTVSRQADELAGPVVRDILVDRSGAVWLATQPDYNESDSEDQGGVHRLAPDGTWTTFVLPQNPGDEYRSDKDRGVISLAPDSAGRLLGGMTNGRIMRIEPGGAITTLVPGDLLPSDTIDGLAAGGRGEVWAATPRGLAHWSQTSGWRTLHTADGLPTAVVTTVAIDPAGDVWAGLDPAWDGARSEWVATGVVHVGADGSVLRVDLPADQVGRGVQALAFDAHGGLWVAAHTLVERYNVWERRGTGVSYRAANGRWTHFAPSESQHLDAVRAIVVDRAGTAWFATDLGLAAYQPDGTWRSVSAGLVSLDVLSAGLDPAGRLWIGSDAGVQRRNPDGSWRNWTSADGLSDDYVQDLAFDAMGRAWLATRYGGVTVMPPVGD